MNHSRTPLLLTCLLIVCATMAFGQGNNKVTKGPAPEWVKQIVPNWEAKIPEADVSQGVHTVLIDLQTHDPLGQFYRHRCEKILNEKGLETLSETRVDFDPAYESLTFHFVRIYRNGQMLDRLQMDQVSTIQMEQRADRHMYDGALSAMIFVEDLRVGDFLEVAYTIKGINPVVKGHTAEILHLNSMFPMDAMFHRIILPMGFKGQINYLNAAVKPEVSTSNGYQVLDWVGHDMELIDYEDNMPSEYNPYQTVEISDFVTWNEVAKHVATFFAKIDWGGATITRFADSLLQTHPQPEDAALAALRFVQDDIRYLGMEGGINGYQPHASAQTLRQRFGDCKDKSLLLVGILRALHLEAWPVLVNTIDRAEVPKKLPTPFSFDHCIVKMRLADSTLWLDPTISNQGGSLRHNSHPNYAAGLVIGDADSAMQTIQRFPYGKGIKITEDWGLTAAGEQVTLRVQTVYQGFEADNIRYQFRSSSSNDLQKDYLAYVASNYGKVEPVGEPQITDDRIANRLVTTEEYKLLNPWLRTGGQDGKYYFDIYPSLFSDYIKEIGQVKRKHPWALEFPLKLETTVVIHLPKKVLILPEKQEISAKQFAFTCTLTPDNYQKNLTVKFSFETKAGRVEPKDFEVFAEKFTKVRRKMSFRIDESYFKEVKERSAFDQFINEDRGKIFFMVLIAAFGLGFFVYEKYFKRKK